MFIANKINNIESGNKLIKKFAKSKTIKLSKSKKLKSEKLAKPKKLSKSKNLSKFDIKKARLNFLNLNARIIFNCLQLVFIKTVIL